ncbi:MAG TPA: Rieske 2Fe-2S domain-containing protein [Burkholderiales bacterium]|jgi:toluene monooxygenase system ferredoxin subunit|nr:Rieske 2Fe-2S domain-containing protein [Burkholderiales bacterium]
MTRRFACLRSEVPADGLKECEIEGDLKVLLANSGDEYFAYQAICPHQDTPLCEGLYDGSVLTCHLHLWQWDIRNGAPIGLAEAPLQRYPVELEDDSIFVIDPTALDVAELFTDLPQQTLHDVMALAKREEHAAATTLYAEGDPAEDFFVLDSGRVEFLVGRGERSSPAGFMLRKGEVFGWNALLENQPRRIAKATCIENSVTLRINGREAIAILERDPASGYRVMRKLSALISRYVSPPGAT